LQLLAAGGVGAAGAAIVGCGDDDDEPAATPGTTATTGTGATPGSATAGASVSPSETPKTGGRLKTLFPADFINFDFHLAISSNTLGMTGIFAQTLLRYSYDSPVSKTVTGHLAKDWEQVDEQTLSLTIDERAKWHDVAPVSGRAVDSGDIKASLDRILDPNTKTGLIRHIVDFVDSVEAPDASHITLKLKIPLSGLDKILASCFLYMMPREGVTGAYDPKAVAIGSGPFSVTSFQAGSSIKFDRVPNYWKQGLPYVDGVDHVVVADTAQAFNALITGDVSMGDVVYTNVAGLKSRNPKALITQFPTSTARSVWIPDKPGSPYKDIRVRQAFKYAVDQDQIIDRIYNGKENASFTGVITPASADIALPEAEARQIWGRDLTRARQLLSDAGHSNGITLPMMFSTQHGGQLVADIAQVLTAQLAEVGITLEITDRDSVTGNAIMLDPTKKDYGASLYLNSANSGGDELDWLYKAYARNGLYNMTQDSESVDPTLQDLIQKMIGEFDKDERLELIYDIQRRIGETAISIPTPAGFNYHAQQENVRNYGPHLSEFFRTSTRKFEDVWLA